MVLDNDCLVVGGESEPRTVPCRFSLRPSLGPVGGKVVFGRGSFTTCSGLSEKIELENKHELWRRSDSDPLEQHQLWAWRRMRRVQRLHKAQLHWKDQYEDPQRHRERLAQVAPQLAQLF